MRTSVLNKVPLFRLVSINDPTHADSLLRTVHNSSSSSKTWRGRGRCSLRIGMNGKRRRSWIGKWIGFIEAICSRKHFSLGERKDKLIQSNVQRRLREHSAKRDRKGYTKHPRAVSEHYRHSKSENRRNRRPHQGEKSSKGRVRIRSQ